MFVAQQGPAPLSVHHNPTEQLAKTNLPPSESSDEEPAFVGTAVGSAAATLPASIGSAAVVPLPPRGTNQRQPGQCQDHSKVGKFHAQSFRMGKHACERTPRDPWRWWRWCWQCGLCICVACLWRGALRILLRSVRPAEPGGVGVLLTLHPRRLASKTCPQAAAACRCARRRRRRRQRCPRLR